MSKEIPVGFRIDEVLYKRLRTIALSKDKPVKRLLCEIIEEYIKAEDKDSLTEKIMSPNEQKL